MQNDPLDSNSLSSNAVSSIYLDSMNSIWVTTFGGGVNRYLGNGQFERFPKTGVINGQFSDLRTLRIVMDNSGNLWIATAGGGLIVLDPHSGKTVNL